MALVSWLKVFTNLLMMPVEIDNTFGLNDGPSDLWTNITSVSAMLENPLPCWQFPAVLATG